MKIQAEHLINFLVKSSINGQIITSAMVFAPEGIISRVRSQDNCCATLTLLSKNCIKEYTPRETIYIRDTSFLIRKLKNMVSGELIVDIKEAQMFVKDESGSGFEERLTSQEVADNVLGKEIAIGMMEKFDGGTDINLEILQKVRKYIETTESDYVNFVIEKGVLNANVRTGLKEGANVCCPISYKNVRSTFFSNTLKNFLSVFTLGSVVVSFMGDEKPALFKEKSEEISFKAMIAPVVQDE